MSVINYPPLTSKSTYERNKRTYWHAEGGRGSEFKHKYAEQKVKAET